MANLKYKRIVVAYHGCDAALASAVLAGKRRLAPSANPYDWLGRGIYFWEHGPQRAYEWAIEQAKFSGTKIAEPGVLGAKINLGVCLDLLDTANTNLLGRRFFQFRRFMRENRVPMPQNREARGSRPGDKVLRFRDCAVIDFAARVVAETEGIYYQTVRGVWRISGRQTGFSSVENHGEITHPDRRPR
jgi:hypothetical protein